MLKTIKIKDRTTINFKLKQNRRTKNVRLTVYCDGTVVVSTPVGITFDKIIGFLTKKSEWVLQKLEFFKTHPVVIGPKTTRRDYLRLKQQALNLANLKVEEFNRFYGFEYNQINIKNQKTRWGSCSKKGNLNFNYKIINLPDHLLNYLVVHELCHLKEMNHKKCFWDLVAKTAPDYKILRKNLQKFNG